jgi:hypothetical protein
MSERNNNTTDSIMLFENDTFPSYLRELPDFRVVLCTTHRCCYTLDNLTRHLLEKHRLMTRERQSIELSSRLNYVADYNTGVVHPRDGVNEIHGLGTKLGFICHFPDCDFRSTGKDGMRKHYRIGHQWKTKSDGDMPWHEAYMQTLFKQTSQQRYFAVVLADPVQGRQSATSQYIFLYANAPHNAPASSRNR